MRSKYDPERHHRHSLRLQNYDYTQAGAYFVTICTRDRECLLGEIVDGEMRLNGYGQVVLEEWVRSAQIREEIEIDQYVVMPNHLHGIVIIGDGRSIEKTDPVGATGRSPLQLTHRVSPYGPAKRSLGAMIAGFKSAATRRINALRGTPGMPVWQRNYYEHIIRNHAELQRIRRYVAENPARWFEDRENPATKYR